MSEKEYLDNDREVLAMVARMKATGEKPKGGELDTRQVSVLPADRAESVLALDERIQTVKPMVMPGGIGLLALIMASVNWMHPLLALAITMASVAVGVYKFRRDKV